MGSPSCARIAVPVAIAAVALGACGSTRRTPGRPAETPLARRAGRLAAARILRLEGAKVSRRLMVAVKAPRCFASGASTYTCYAIADVTRRPGQEPDFLGSLSTWTVTVAVDATTQRMRVVRASEGLQQPARTGG